MRKYVKIVAGILLIMILIITQYCLKKNSSKKKLFAKNEAIYIKPLKNDIWLECKLYDENNLNIKNRYVFLPVNADEDSVEIYNNYKETIEIAGLKILPQKSKKINYIDSEKIEIKDSKKSWYLSLFKSGAEASVFVNDTTGVFKNFNGDIVNTDFYSFLVDNKENSVKDSECIIVDKDRINKTTLKKIKGRGNTSWNEAGKKPFNLTFYDQTLIGHTNSRKFSFISTTYDPIMIRNKLVQDLSNEVGVPYSPDISYADFYINGVYQGVYEICEKIDVGKKSLISLENNYKDNENNFNFVVELDIGNYENDNFFISNKGFPIILKTPDLDEYNKDELIENKQYNYIKETFQKFENALYNGTLEDLEKICDINSLAKMYLIQEFGKNCDGGFTSTFFIYNAKEEKFYVAPTWDCDLMFGSKEIYRDGCENSTQEVDGWFTRTASFEGKPNPLGQAFGLSGKTSAGKTFEEICKIEWKENLEPAINILLGYSSSKGRLKSLDDYARQVEIAFRNNNLIYGHEYTNKIHLINSVDLNKLYEYEYQKKLYR